MQGIGLAEQYLGENHSITTTIRNSYLAAKRTLATKARVRPCSATRGQKSPAKAGSRLLLSPRSGSLRSPSPLSKDQRGPRSPLHAPLSPMLCQEPHYLLCRHLRFKALPVQARRRRRKAIRVETRVKLLRCPQQTHFSALVSDSKRVLSRIKRRNPQVSKPLDRLQQQRLRFRRLRLARTSAKVGRAV